MQDAERTVRCDAERCAKTSPVAGRGVAAHLGGAVQIAVASLNHRRRAPRSPSASPVGTIGAAKGYERLKADPAQNARFQGDEHEQARQQ